MSQTMKFYDVPVSSQTHLLTQTKAWTICSRCQTPWWCPSKSDTLNLLLKTESCHHPTGSELKINLPQPGSA